MQNAISNKIRLILNELAILNQPEILEGNYFFDLATLKKLKTLSSELYLCSDQLIFGINTNTGSEKVTSHAEILVDALIAEPEEDVMPIESAEVNISVPLADMEPENTIPDIAEEEPEILSKAVSIEEVPSENVVHTQEKSNNNIFDGKLSLTRRFEYTNNLFSSKVGDFAGFLDEISNADSLSSALIIFDNEFENRGWKRKSETASDLKQLIRKYKI